MLATFFHSNLLFVSHRHRHLSFYLVNQGADLKAEDRNKYTPIDFARIKAFYAFADEINRRILVSIFSF
jgi:hypothetical protein